MVEAMHNVCEAATDRENSVERVVITSSIRAVTAEENAKSSSSEKGHLESVDPYAEEVREMERTVERYVESLN